MNTKENKKAPYWLSTLSASCVLFSFGFFTFTVIEYGSNTPFQMMLSGINGLVILIFGSIVFEGIRLMRKHGIKSRPE